MEVTKKAEYAISALLELAMNRSVYFFKEIAFRQNIPPIFASDHSHVRQQRLG